MSSSESDRSLGRGKRIKKVNRNIDYENSESDSGNNLNIYFITEYLNVKFLFNFVVPTLMCCVSFLRLSNKT